MILMRPTMTVGWLLTAILAMAIVLSPVSGVVRSDEPVAPSIEQQPLFEAGKDGYVKYRIPSLVVTSRGTVLALCEARKKSGHDWDDVDLALRRSTDHGRTWSKLQIIAEQGELTINQPCPVIDHQTGTIWLPLCRGSKPGLGNAEVLLMKSTDDGQTWSRPVSIHQSVADPSWTFIGTGPGHGIQLKSGRLLIPCWFDLTPTCGEVQSSCCIYSDDHGETWKRGEPLTRNACDECDIVELEDGTVYLNARSHSQKQRAYAFSKDGGHSWSAVQYDPNQPEPCCDGALIRLSDSRHLDRNRVLVACPTNPDTRAHIRVRMSYDECQTWPIASEPLAHFGGYSDLAVTGDRQILCLYEDFGENRFNLVLAKFNVEWLSGGKDTLAPPPASKPISFQYDEGTDLKTRDGKEKAVRVQERTIPPVRGEVFVYASFDALTTNPAEFVHDEPRGMQTVAIGHGRAGDFSPCVSFGMARDTHSGLGNRALLLPWLSDGKFDDFGGSRCHVLERPDREAIAQSSRGLERSGNPRTTRGTRIASRRDARIVVTCTAGETIATTSGIPLGCGPREGTVCRGSTLRFDPRLLSATPSASTRLLSVTPSASSCHQGLPNHELPCNTRETDFEDSRTATVMKHM